MSKNRFSLIISLLVHSEKEQLQRHRNIRFEFVRFEMWVTYASFFKSQDSLGFPFRLPILVP